MGEREQPLTLEVASIRPIPKGERHGKARDLFTVWFGTNVMLLTVITGGLAVTEFKLSFGWAVLSLTLGNLIGAIFMALHSAQGARLGVPQMVQTRGQFGSLGSLLVVGIVLIMYVGFVSSNLVLSGEALAAIWPGFGDAAGIVLVGILSIIAAIYGYDLIHAYARLMTYLSGAALLGVLVWILAHGLPADFLTRNGFHLSGFLGALSAAALWQIAYAPYVSDYSRYMPEDTGPKSAFWASYWGCSLGSLLPMLLGVVVGLSTTEKSLVLGLTHLAGAIAPAALIVLTVSIASSSAMNLYCGTLSAITFAQTLVPSVAPGPWARVLLSVGLFLASLAGALLSKEAFLLNYESFILILLYVLVPWTAINLVDYYLLRRGRYDVEAFFRADGGIYGRFNLTAIGCYVLGILVEIPFIDSPLYTGSLAKAAGKIDLSWIVGLLVTAPAYYFLAKRARNSEPLAQWTPGASQS
jgi:NCS1 family nucleobase:cation symporter-1